MKITDFNKSIAKSEAGKTQVNIAQISEVSKVINKLTSGELYKLIRKIK